MGIIKLIKNYRTLGHDEFMKKWKEGISKIDPTQQIKNQLLFTKITLFGILCGFVISCYYWKTSWWLAIILLGAMLNTGAQYFALRNQLIRMQEMFGQLNEKEEVKNV